MTATPNEDEVAWAQAVLEAQRWVFAKTMPTNPHWYTLLRTWNDSETFFRVVEIIRRRGKVVLFRGWRYTVIDLNGYRYWTMGEPIRQVIGINRRVLEPHEMTA